MYTLMTPFIQTINSAARGDRLASLIYACKTYIEEIAFFPQLTQSSSSFQTRAQSPSHTLLFLDACMQQKH